MVRFPGGPRNSLRHRAVACRVWTAVSAMALASGPSPEPIDRGSRLEPLVDRFLIQSLAGGARLQIHKPRRREVVLVHDAPWERNLTAHHTLFRDGGIYRMYYGGRHCQPGRKVRHVLACHAESRDDDGVYALKSPDGIHWSLLSREPVILKGDMSLDSQNLAFWDSLPDGSLSDRPLWSLLGEENEVQE